MGPNPKSRSRTSYKFKSETILSQPQMDITEQPEATLATKTLKALHLVFKILLAP